MKGMSLRSCFATTLLMAGCMVGCSGVSPSSKGTEPAPAVPVPAPPKNQGDPAASPPPSQIVRLDNGVTVTVRQSIGADDAQLQLGLLSGTATSTAGLPELATWTMVEDSDPSQGRTSLRQAIQRLGGTIRLQLGPLTTWVDIRVPNKHWQAAVNALKNALAAPSQSRHQIERIRKAVVEERSQWIRRDPLLAMATALILGEGSTANYMRALLDRDPAEVSLFQARSLRPERSLLTIEVAGDPARVAADLSNAGTSGLGGWRPPAALPASSTPAPRAFVSGLHWATIGPANECRVAIVMPLPDISFAGLLATDMLILHCCLTLDGTGGRLEQLMRQRGLGHVQWRSDFVQTADSIALVLTAGMRPDEAGRVWETLQLARRSLLDVPPTQSEITLAVRRARLTVRLGELDARSRLRVQTNWHLRGLTPTQVDERVLALGKQTAVNPALVQTFIDQPAAVIVIGGEVPEGITDVQPFELLPQGFEAAPTNTPEQASASATPWLDRAITAVGGDDQLRRLTGFTAESRLSHDQAPAAADKVVWQSNGNLRRTRELLDQKIVTTIQDSNWTEELGKTRKSLTANEVEPLRRQMARHPLLLLAAVARGEMKFRAIAQRTIGDRELMVLEAIGGRFDRLRLHIDTISHLVRVVEVWETVADGSVLHVEEAWSDYRRTQGLRAPFHCFTMQDDGENRTETVFSSWEPTLRAL